MKIVEIGLAFVAVLGIVFHLLLYPGGGVLTILSFSLLSMFYFFLGFFVFSNLSFEQMTKSETFKNTSKFRLVGAGITGFVLSVACIGILFKLQSYPGATFQLIISALGLGVIFLLSLWKFITTKDSFYTNILKRVIPFSALVLVLAFAPASKLLSWQYPNDPDYVKALVNAQAEPDNEALWDSVEVEGLKMDLRIQEEQELED